VIRNYDQPASNTELFLKKDLEKATLHRFGFGTDKHQASGQTVGGKICMFTPSEITILQDQNLKEGMNRVGIIFAILEIRQEFN